MTSQEFMTEVRKSHNRSIKILIEKGKEYSVDADRLGQFHKVAHVQDISPAEALIGMAVKHFISICDMAKDSHNYTIQRWNEKIGDLRNYTYLLDALLRDMGVDSD